jgi:N-acetylneuraminic acid mutarotase
VLGNKLYVVGGSGRHGVGNVYAYDPVRNTWTTKPALPTRRLQLAAGVVTDGVGARILAVGGLTDALATSAANEAYKP